MVAWTLMENDEEFVTREQFERLYPRGAAMVQCRFCQKLLLVPYGEHPYCRTHLN